ncbi:alpha-N-arabinofuranosidase [Brachybacterium sp. UMB0905]|uniref:arabinosylfuranosidase ArfA n=1 Tax=Brachybacterium sp. UMB0905 TaxID=2069310 RepID=UPI000C7FB542|nr:alpha-N-arabinofuranosidase [Brachybacterium sp. UMB0905]PMC74513.1 alpha-L-arabinofuranosidase [Brachybacterium sp. UMB0905]
MSSLARIALHPQFVIAPVRRRLFGAFVEHMGRCVYTGIVEPGHPRADAQGLREDVLELVRELGVSMVRYPGGNFVSGYRWEDGVGPVEQRPVRRDLAWHSTEPNTFGVDEFMAWCAAAQVEPMMAVNLGTRGVQAAADLLEYCNGAPGTELADARARNGHPEPYDVRLWCLGNEMDGPWQLGHMPPEQYGMLAGATARALHRADPGLELIACGSSHWTMPTYGRWEQVVLEACGDEVAMISAHVYYQQRDADAASYLASADDLDGYLRAVAAVCDHVAAMQGSREQVLISLDEWNVVHPGPDPGEEPSGDDWPIAPRFAESTYDVQDAVVLGSLLITILQHADRVGAACLAQLVNVLAPIRTTPGGPAWRQSIFHPFALTSRHAHGTVLHTVVDSPMFTSARHGESTCLDAVATWDDEEGLLTVFAVNRSAEETLELAVDVSAFGPLTVIEALHLHEEDPRTVNSAEDPAAVTPRPLPGVHAEDGRILAELPPICWAMLRLRAEQP